MQSFKVLYTNASTKKRKIYLDGILNMSTKDERVSCHLMSLSGDEVHHSTLSKVNASVFLDSLRKGETVTAGWYNIQLDEEQINNDPANQDALLDQGFTSFCKVNKKAKEVAITPSTTSVKTEKEVAQLDPFLARVMQPHQVDAAIFLLKCLNERTAPKSIPKDSFSSDFNTASKRSRVSSGPHLGAILGL